MRRVSLRLSDDAAARLAAEAARRGLSEAEVIRLAIDHLLEAPPAGAAAAVPERAPSAFGMRVEEGRRMRRPPSPG